MSIVKASENRVMTGVHFMLGNYALVEGAVSAGCEFFAGYPITPANEISERMSQRLPQVGGKFVQAEDELCSIFALAGASLAGAKVMTATASAGYNYMQEGLGYCYTVEAPIVVADVMRTRGDNFASYADVYQMRYGCSGDYEAIVVCPSSVQELYDYAIWAFNLAEEYRNPVIIMSEITIALMRERLDIPKASEIELYNRKYTTKSPEDYLPFGADTPYGCPDFAPLGKGYNTIYSLNPHNEYGSIDWNPDEFEQLYKRVCGKISENSDTILVRAGNDLNIQSTDDLSGKTVAVTAGAVEELTCEAFNEDFESRGMDPITILQLPTSNDAVVAVQNAQADCMVYSAASAAYAMSQQPGVFETTTVFDTDTVIGIATRKGDTEMQEAIQKCLDILVENGTYDSLMEKYNLASDLSYFK